MCTAFTKSKSFYFKLSLDVAVIELTKTATQLLQILLATLTLKFVKF